MDIDYQKAIEDVSLLFKIIFIAEGWNKNKLPGTLKRMCLRGNRERKKKTGNATNTMKNKN